MKTLLILIALFSSNSFADYLNRDCERSNLTVSLEIHDRYALPKFIYAKEGDVLCFQIANQSSSPVAFAVERMPLTDSLRINFSRNYSLKFPKKGEYAFKIRGSYILEMPKIIILDKSNFESFEKDEYLKNSIKNRH